MSILKRCCGDTMMNGISQCIAQSRQLVIQAIEFNNKRITQEQGTYTRIFCIEISRIGLSLSFDKFHETGRSNTLVNMIGHHRISHQRGLRMCNGQCKRIKIIEVILFITAADLAASRQANMISIFHTAKFHLIIRVKKDLRINSKNAVSIQQEALSFP